MSKPPSAASVLKNLKKQSYAPVTKDIAGNFIIPNLSGITSNIDANNKLGAIYATNAALAAHIALAQAHSDYLLNSGDTASGAYVFTGNLWLNQNFSFPFSTGALMLGAAGTSLIAHDGTNLILENNLAGTDNPVYIGRTGADKLVAGSLEVDTPTLVVNKTGYLDKVGIGTATPNAELEVKDATGDSELRITSSANSPILHLREENTYVDWDIILDNADSQKLKFNADGTTIVTFEKTGNVGIGTATPNVSLDVKPAGVAEVKIAANGNLAKLYLERYGTSVRKYSIYTGLTQSLRIKDETAVADRLTIDAAGNVGIGTSSPGELLEVSKSQNTDTSILIKNENVGATAIAGLGIKTDGANVGILWKYGSGYTNNIFGSSRANNLVLATQNANDDLMIGTIADANVIFGQNNAEVMRIDTAGNVGIGTATPAGALDVTSTTGGFIVPRMTTAQVAALTPVNGMIVYDLTLNKFQFYENGAWVSGSGLV